MRNLFLPGAVVLAVLALVLVWSGKRKIDGVSVFSNHFSSSLANDLGMGTIPVAHGRVKLKLSTRPLCQLGDWDLIRMDLGYSKQPSLLLSIEPLEAGQAVSPTAIPIAADKVPAGVDGTVDLSSLPTPALLGLFFCKDSAATGHCREKEVKDITMIPIRDGMAFQKDHSFQAPDTNYFFQLLLYDGASVLFMRQGTPEPAAEKTKLLDKIARVFPGPQGAASRKTAELALSYQTTLKSMPLEIANDALAVVLPASDPKCPQASPPGYEKVRAKVEEHLRQFKKGQ